MSALMRTHVCEYIESCHVECRASEEIGAAAKALARVQRRGGRRAARQARLWQACCGAAARRRGSGERAAARPRRAKHRCCRRRGRRRGEGQHERGLRARARH